MNQTPEVGRLLAGRVAIITGGDRGIGREIALAMAGAGAKVVLAARNQSALAEVEAEIAAAGGTAVSARTDITKAGEIEAMVVKARERLGPIDILVNNSGIAGPTAKIEEITSEQWEEVFTVNVTGMFLCVKAVLPEMKQRRWGRIINISSVTGKRPLPQRAPYAASKMAVVGLTRTLAWEAGAYNITVNAISPGATEGPRIRDVIASIASATGKNPEEISHQFTEQSPLKRFTRAQDIASMAVFLASDLAANITGEDMNVCAGLVMY